MARACRLLSWSLLCTIASCLNVNEITGKLHTRLNAQCNDSMNGSRRLFVNSVLSSAMTLFVTPTKSNGVTRAVGGAEESCRAAGNCLEIGEWDGAVGWSWGAKERCDPSDPLCGADGTLRSSLMGKQVPQPVVDITHIALIRIDVGRKESGVLKLGLYGNECPGAVLELIDFLSQGLTTQAGNGDSMKTMTSPVSLAAGGVVSYINPGVAVEFGVPSQSNAFGRSRGLSRVTDFIPQKRPSASITANDKVTRSHDAAGLLSVSIKGLGYGGTGFESDDESFERAFLITADSTPSMDKSRRVVGQVLDAESMAFLERLANLPTQRGIRGVVPGQTSGLPLIRVTVNDAAVSKVTGGPSLM
ncbi:hypothetical protein MPSEU_000311600 [Mayamaea pseudoterrestris]|nr:hypothetical protein MPSEU_000311600 [Mayamaea pseudoterrestris]